MSNFNPNGKVYTFVFAGALTLFCAVILGTAATALKERQEENMDVDKKKKILAALNIYDANVKEKTLDKKQVKAYFSEAGGDAGKLKKIAVNGQGEVLAVGEGITQKELDELDLEKQMKKFRKEEDAGKRKYPMYVMTDKDGKAQAYVVPVFGYGLWSFCYGVIAIEADAKTVRKLVYYDHKETPGLGGEIEKDYFSNQWAGKTFLNNKGVVALTTAKAPKESWETQAVSGATFTMVGVDKMLKKYLTIYDAYLSKKRGADK